MGKLFFGVDMQATIGDAIPVGAVPALTLRKKAYGAYDAAHPSRGRAVTTTDYDCRGTISSFTREEMKDDPNIQEGDSYVSVIAAPLASFGIEPTKDDLLLDDDGNVYTVVGVTTSGLRASFMCHLRGLTQMADE